VTTYSNNPSQTLDPTSTQSFDPSARVNIKLGPDSSEATGHTLEKPVDQIVNQTSSQVQRLDQEPKLNLADEIKFLTDDFANLKTQELDMPNYGTKLDNLILAICHPGQSFKPSQEISELLANLDLISQVNSTSLDPQIRVFADKLSFLVKLLRTTDKPDLPFVRNYLKAKEEILQKTLQEITSENSPSGNKRKYGYAELSGFIDEYALDLSRQGLNFENHINDQNQLKQLAAFEVLCDFWFRISSIVSFKLKCGISNFNYQNLAQNKHLNLIRGFFTQKLQSNYFSLQNAAKELIETLLDFEKAVGANADLNFQIFKDYLNQQQPISSTQAVATEQIELNGSQQVRVQVEKPQFDGSQQVRAQVESPQGSQQVRVQVEKPQFDGSQQVRAQVEQKAVTDEQAKEAMQSTTLNQNILPSETSDEDEDGHEEKSQSLFEKFNTWRTERKEVKRIKLEIKALEKQLKSLYGFVLDTQTKKNCQFDPSRIKKLLERQQNECQNSLINLSGPLSENLIHLSQLLKTGNTWQSAYQKLKSDPLNS
jgi:hypothetical protein